MNTLQQTIGSQTTYSGGEHSYLDGYRVRIVAVLKDALAPNGGDGPRVSDDETLARLGGVTRLDRVEVQPWLPGEQRFSFVTSDARATDLACFATLGRSSGSTKRRAR